MDAFISDSSKRTRDEERNIGKIILLWKFVETNNVLLFEVGGFYLMPCEATMAGIGAT